jgi:hypothetical protein
VSEFGGSGVAIGVPRKPIPVPVPEAPTIRGYCRSEEPKPDRWRWNCRLYLKRAPRQPGQGLGARTEVELVEGLTGDPGLVSHIFRDQSPIFIQRPQSLRLPLRIAFPSDINLVPPPLQPLTMPGPVRPNRPIGLRIAHQPLQVL